MTELCQPCGSCSTSGKKAVVDRLTRDLDELMERGAYQEALPVAERLLDEVGDLHGRTGADYASALNDVASVERYLGRYGDAERRFLAAARILREERGAWDSEYATAVNNLAGLHRLTGEVERAEREFAEALGVYERVLEPDDWRSVSCLNNLGLLYQDTGRLDEAMACFVRALELLQGAEGGGDPSSIATTLMNGAVCAGKMGDAEEARALFGHAMGLIERLHGRRSAAFSGALNNLAAFHVDQGEPERALPLLEESRETARMLFGADSSAYRLVCANIGRVRERAGEGG